MSSPWSRQATTERPGAPDDDAVPDEGSADAVTPEGDDDGPPAGDTSATSGTPDDSPSGTNGHALDDDEMAAAFGRPTDGSTAAGGADTAGAETRRHERVGSREP